MENNQLQKASHRVTFLVPDLATAGTQRVQVMVAGAVAALGFEVDLINCGHPASLSALVPGDVRLIELNHANPMAALPFLVRYLRREKPCAMFPAINSANLLALAAVRLARLETRLVMTVHTHFDKKWRQQFYPSAIIRRPLFKWMYRQASHVVAVSGEIHDLLVKGMGVDPEKVTTIPNPVDREGIVSRSREPVQHPWFAPGGPPVVLAVGRLDPQKDFVTLIRAFKQVAQTRQARLLIIGEGPQRAPLEKLVRELDLQGEVDLAGFNPNPYPWMARASLFVLSSDSEGFGLVLAEALVLGRPSVATDCGAAVRELAGHFGNVGLVPEADPEMLAHAIVEGLREPRSDAQQEGKWEKYSPENAARGWMKAAGFNIPQ